MRGNFKIDRYHKNDLNKNTFNDEFLQKNINYFNLTPSKINNRITINNNFFPKDIKDDKINLFQEKEIKELYKQMNNTYKNLNIIENNLHNLNSEYGINEINSHMGRNNHNFDHIAPYRQTEYFINKSEKQNIFRQNKINNINNINNSNFKRNIKNLNFNHKINRNEINYNNYTSNNFYPKGNLQKMNNNTIRNSNLNDFNFINVTNIGGIRNKEYNELYEIHKIEKEIIKTNLEIQNEKNRCKKKVEEEKKRKMKEMKKRIKEEKKLKEIQKQLKEFEVEERIKEFEKQLKEFEEEEEEQEQKRKIEEEKKRKINEEKRKILELNFRRREENSEKNFNNNLYFNQNFHYNLHLNENIIQNPQNNNDSCIRGNSFNSLTITDNDNEISDFNGLNELDNGRIELLDFNFGSNLLYEIMNFFREPPKKIEILEKLPEKIIDSINNLKDENKRCTICLEDFIVKDIVIYLPCFHFFHKDCIIKWIEQNPTCPLCKFDINNIDYKTE